MMDFVEFSCWRLSSRGEDPKVTMMKWLDIEKATPVEKTDHTGEGPKGEKGQLRLPVLKKNGEFWGGQEDRVSDNVENSTKPKKITKKEKVEDMIADLSNSIDEDSLMGLKRNLRDIGVEDGLLTSSGSAGSNQALTPIKRTSPSGTPETPVQKKVKAFDLSSERADKKKNAKSFAANLTKSVELALGKCKEALDKAGEDSGKVTLYELTEHVSICTIRMEFMKVEMLGFRLIGKFRKPWKMRNKWIWNGM